VRDPDHDTSVVDVGVSNRRATKAWGRRAGGAEALGLPPGSSDDGAPATGAPELESRVGDTLSYVAGTRGATRHDDGVDTTG
jgi:hypothetical protein